MSTVYKVRVDFKFYLYYEWRKSLENVVTKKVITEAGVLLNFVDEKSPAFI